VTAQRHDPEGWLAELRALYARVDALYADWRCPESADCCRFGLTGRQPFVTELELLAIRVALAERATPARRSLPISTARDALRACPLLDARGRCTVYAVRPMGCRSYYCARAQRGAGPEPAALQTLFDELQLLAARHRLGGERLRALCAALEDGWLVSA
jgi:Fe-S-cluster containining protein